jgi:hypothetical protein
MLGLQPPALHPHQGGALRPLLVDVAPLQIARKHHPGRMPVQLAPQMDMPQRPVIVAVRGELLDRAGGVAAVVGVLGGGVQQPDIDLARHRRRVGERQVVGDRLVREALPMDHHRQPRHLEAMRPVRIEQGGTLGPGQLPGEHALCVMVAADGIDRNPRPREPPELPHQEVPGGIILPIAIEQIPGEQHERHLFPQREVHEVDHGLPRGAADALGGGTGFEAAQGRVEVEVGGVEEGEVHAVGVYARWGACGRGQAIRGPPVHTRHAITVVPGLDVGIHIKVERRVLWWREP